MRTNHLFYLVLLTSIGLLFGGPYIPWVGVVFELIDALPWWIGIFVVMVPLFLILTPINNYALLWRKRMGRDVLAEERQESNGVISIVPTDRN